MRKQTRDSEVVFVVPTLKVTLESPQSSGSRLPTDLQVFPYWYTAQGTMEHFPIFGAQPSSLLHLRCAADWFCPILQALDLPATAGQPLNLGTTRLSL